jgi:hypothetical protein
MEYVSKELESQNILHGIIDFFNWATLEIGNYQNISIPTSGIYGGQKSRLRPVTDPRFSDGRVWEGYADDWVWESGVSFTPAPIQISGVYVGGTLYTKDDASYGHYVDYKRGRVVFSGVVDTSSVVTAEFSPRIISFYDSDSAPAKQVMYENYRVDDSMYTNPASGSWNVLHDLRRELPFVSVSVSPTTSYKPYQIGGGQLGQIDIHFSVYAQNKFWRDQICDMLGRQNHKAIWLPNRGTMKVSTDYPFDLDYKGSLVDTPVEYPDIVKPTGDGGYRWHQIYFDKTTKQFVDFRDDFVYEGLVKTTAQIRL